MKSNVIKFYPSNASENPDLVLEQAIGQFENILILGWNKENGLLDARASRGMGGDILLLIEQFKYKLIRGDYKDEE